MPTALRSSLEQTLYNLPNVDSWEVGKFGSYLDQVIPAFWLCDLDLIHRFTLLPSVGTWLKVQPEPGVPNFSLQHR